MADTLLSLRGLKAQFRTRNRVVRVVNGVSFDVAEGETVGVVGESGSGKTVSQLSYLRLLPEPPLEIVGGQAFFRGQDLLRCSAAQMRSIRGDAISFIFQEPMTSLNPYLRVGTQVMEPLRVHRKQSVREAWKNAEQALERVGLPHSRSAMRAYPHEFSGGMRQRAMIAMALTTRPRLLIADEPTTALDVTVQAQILSLLREIQRETKMAMVFITHDLGIIASIAHRVVVLYAGHVLEQGGVEDLFYRSQHPYTQALLACTPRVDTFQQNLPAIRGQLDLASLSPGCPFSGRCLHEMDICRKTFPPARKLGTLESYCHWEGASDAPRR